MTKINNQKTKTKTLKNKAWEPTTMWRSLMLKPTQLAEPLQCIQKLAKPSESLQCRCGISLRSQKYSVTSCMRSSQFASCFPHHGLHTLF